MRTSKLLNALDVTSDPPARRSQAIAPGQLACSPRQAATALGIAQSTAWAWIRDGRLASRKVCGRRLVVVESVRALLGPEGK